MDSDDDIETIANDILEYEHLFDVPDCPLLDIPADSVVDESNYYGVDFSKHPVRMLFYSGASNFFAGMLLSENVAFDQRPIYIFDLQSSNEKMRFVGNFRFYLTTLLNHYLQHGGDCREDAKNLLSTLESKFSEKTIRPEQPIQYKDAQGNISFSIE